MTVLLAIAWIAALSFGARELLNYETAPGAIGLVPSTWPASSNVKLAPKGPTLVMLAHPLCPCTRASVGELAQIMARVQGKVRAYVLFLKPGGTAANWEDSDLRRSAASIPGVTTLIDVDGAEARRFGAQTSGHILLFDPAGRLLFSGGITESRGHAGGNVGESSIESLINDEKTGPRSTVVFGCPLFERTRKGKDSLCRN